MGPYHELWAVSHYMHYSDILQTLVYDWQCRPLSATWNTSVAHVHQNVSTNYCNKIAVNDISFCQYAASEYLIQENSLATDTVNWIMSKMATRMLPICLAEIIAELPV